MHLQPGEEMNLPWSLRDTFDWILPNGRTLGSLWIDFRLAIRIQTQSSIRTESSVPIDHPFVNYSANSFSGGPIHELSAAFW
jgi:hypothetical protein